MSELAQLNNAFELLDRVARCVASSASYSDLLRDLAEATLGLGGADATGIYLLDPDQRRLTVGWEASIPAWPPRVAPGDVIPSGAWPSMLEVAQAQAPRNRIVSDPEFTDAERKHMMENRIGAMADFPIVYSGRCVGIFRLFHRQPNRFAPEVIELGKAIAAIMALAIATSQSVERAVRHSEDQESLSRIAQAAITQRDPRELMQRVADELRALLPFESVSVELWNPSLDRCETVGFSTRSDWPFPGDFTEIYRLSEWPANVRMLREMQFITIDISDNLAWHEHDYLAMRNLKQLHYVPLVYAESCVGAIIFQDSAGREFDEERRQIVAEAAAITSLAAHAAQTLRRSLRERQEQAWQLRVNDVVVNGGDLASVIDEAAAGLLDITGAESCSTTINFAEHEELVDSRFSSSGMIRAARIHRLDTSTWPVVAQAAMQRRQIFSTIDEGSVGPEDAERLLDLKQSWVVAEPLVDGNQLLGQIVLTIPDFSPPNEESLAFLRSMARQISVVAVDHMVRLERERATRTLSAMLRVTQSAIAGSDLRSIIREIAVHCLALDGVDGCAVDFYDAATRQLRNTLAVFSKRWSYEYDESSAVSIDQMPAWRAAILSGKPKLLHVDSPELTEEERGSLVRIGAESVFVIPLSIGTEATWVVNLFSVDKRPLPFHAREAAHEMARQASLAVERVRLFEALQARADTDGVTGLLNHRAILELIDRVLEQPYPTSLLMVDLDSFKLFNDTHGHLAGDRYLNEMGAIIRTRMPSAAKIARYGGDEFLVLLPNTGESQAKALAKSLLADASGLAFDLGGYQVPFRFSIGTSTSVRDGRTRDLLIRQADLAMYDAKEHGGGQLGHSREELIEIPLSAFSALEGLVQAVDRKDHYTRLHSDRVTAVAVNFAEWLERDRTECEALYIAGQLHDIGKIAVPDSILRRPGKLDPAEMMLLRQHVTYGELMVNDVPHRKQVLEAISGHHERWDGNGYPRQLAGEAIPELGRIMALADTYSAITQDRPYLKARSHEEARAEIRRALGAQFDPDLALAFLEFTLCGERGTVAQPPLPSILRSSTPLPGE